MDWAITTLVMLCLGVAKFLMCRFTVDWRH